MLIFRVTKVSWFVEFVDAMTAMMGAVVYQLTSSAVTCNECFGLGDELLCSHRTRSSRNRRVGAARTDHDDVLTMKSVGDGGRTRMGS